ANPLQTMSRSVTMPTKRSFSPIGMAPTSWSRINFASSVTGVSGLTQSTPLCITSLTFMADLRLLELECTRPNVVPPLHPLLNYNEAMGSVAGVRDALRRARTWPDGDDLNYRWQIGFVS